MRLLVWVETLFPCAALHAKSELDEPVWNRATQMVRAIPEK
jgi:hypothetical protein